MIIGHGAIAKVLQDRDDRLYFASGVANSRETRKTEFDREIDLLGSQDRSLHIVYFSSLCVFTSDTLYAHHKRWAERVVKNYYASWTIMRLGNILWAENPHQLVPFLKRWDWETPLDDQYRHLLTKEEFLYWVSLIPHWNCEMNVTGTRLKPIEIIKGWHDELTDSKHCW